MQGVGRTMFFGVLPRELSFPQWTGLEETSAPPPRGKREKSFTPQNKGVQKAQEVNKQRPWNRKRCRKTLTQGEEKKTFSAVRTEGGFVFREKIVLREWHVIRGGGNM